MTIKIPENEPVEHHVTITLEETRFVQPGIAVPPGHRVIFNFNDCVKQFLNDFPTYVHIFIVKKERVYASWGQESSWVLLEDVPPPKDKVLDAIQTAKRRTHRTHGRLQ